MLRICRLIVVVVWGLGVVGGGRSFAISFGNGGFETGVLSDWTQSAIDGFGNGIVPNSIDVSSFGGNHYAEFTTGDFATGPFISTLEQDFVVSSKAPILWFDFSLPTIAPDATGTGTSPFLDSFVASLFDFNGFSSYELLQADRTGAIADPFGTAPGTTGVFQIGLANRTDRNFDGTSFDNYLFLADLSSLAGQSLTLFFDVMNEDDGYISAFRVDNVSPAVPEPGTFVLLGTGLVGLVGYNQWRKRRG